MRSRSLSTSKRVLIVAFKVYVGLCTLLVTACIAFMLWEVASTPTSSGQDHPRTIGAEIPVEPDWTRIRISYDSPQAAPTGHWLFHGLTGTQTLIERAPSQPNGAANGSQPIRSETNRMSPAAGSRR